MSVYDDMSEKAAKARKFKKQEYFRSVYGEDYTSKLVDNQFDTFNGVNKAHDDFFLGLHEITSEVDAQIESNTIDTSAVEYACKELRKAVQVDLRNYAQSIIKLKDDMTKDVLSLNNRSFEDDLEEIAQYIKGLCTDITNFEEAVLARLPKVKKVQEDIQTWNYYQHGSFMKMYKGK